jgi:hypothetical protein
MRALKFYAAAASVCVLASVYAPVGAQQTGPRLSAEDPATTPPKLVPQAPKPTPKLEAEPELKAEVEKLIEMGVQCENINPHGAPHDIEKAYDYCGNLLHKYDAFIKASTNPYFQNKARLFEYYLIPHYAFIAELRGANVLEKRSENLEKAHKYFAVACAYYADAYEFSHAFKDPKTRSKITLRLDPLNKYLQSKYQTDCKGVVAQERAEIERQRKAEAECATGLIEGTKTGTLNQEIGREILSGLKPSQYGNCKLLGELRGFSAAEGECANELTAGSKSGDARFSPERKQAVLNGKAPRAFGYCRLRNALVPRIKLAP